MLYARVTIQGHEFDIGFDVSGKYYPATYHDPEEFPVYTIREVEPVDPIEFNQARDSGTFDMEHLSDANLISMIENIQDEDW